MVKKWIVVLCIIAVLVAACILEDAYIDKTFNNFEKSLQIAKNMLTEDDGSIDNQENIDYLNKVENDWDRNVKVLKGLIWHTGLKEIEIGFSRVITYTEENNFTEAMTELNAVLDYLDAYQDEFIFSLENLL